MDVIHWYPGHMAKAKRQLTELLKYLDVLLEVRDARLPLISHNNDLEPLLKRRPNLILLNKTDLADPKLTKLWVKYFEAQGIPVIEVNGRNGAGVEKIWEVLASKYSAKGGRKAVRAGVIGIPNVGKSSILNRLLGTGTAKTGNMPGITLGKQWVRRKGIEILDMPGLLPPKITDEEAGVKLALIGTIREEIVPTYDMALFLLEHYGEQLFKWQAAGLVLESPEAALDWYAAKRGFRIKGGGFDLNRAITALLNDFRNGRLGRISLEDPPVKDEDGDD